MQISVAFFKINAIKQLNQKARQLPGFYSINYGAITRRIHQLKRNNQKQPNLKRLKVLG